MLPLFIDDMLLLFTVFNKSWVNIIHFTVKLVMRAGGHVWQVAMYGRWPCMAGGHVWQVPMYGRWPCMAGAHVWQVAMYGRWPCMAGGHVWQVAMYGRWPCMDESSYSRYISMLKVQIGAPTGVLSSQFLLYITSMHTFLGIIWQKNYNLLIIQISNIRLLLHAYCM